MSAYSFWTDAELHMGYDQRTRQDSASNLKLTPYEIDVENKMCRIKGSGKEAYEVYLEECTCNDFVRRVKPCKHMYRLAHILGVSQLEREPDVAKIAHHSSNGIFGTFVDTETGEVHKRESQPRINKREIPEELRADIDKFMQRAEGLTLRQLIAVSRSIPSSNSAYNEPWYKVTVDKELAQLLVDVELFRIIDATVTKKINHIVEVHKLPNGETNVYSRMVLAEILDIVDPKQSVNRRGPTKTWIKKLTTTFEEALEDINEQIYLLEATPFIGYRYATIYNKMKKLRVKAVMCSECLENGLEPSYVKMSEDEYAHKEGQKHCCTCGEPLNAA